MGDCLLPKVKLRSDGSSDPRLSYDSGPDPEWWENDSAPAGRSATHRSGYGHEANLDRSGALVRQRPDIEELFEQALAGVLPRTRELKSWEPDKLNPRHLHVLLMKAAGASNKRIAAETGIAEPTVSIVCRHPDGQYILARILTYAAENVVDVEAQLKAAAPAITLELVREFHSDELRKETKIKLGFGLLDRAGYGGTTKQESTVKHEFVVPEKSAGLLSEAIRESQQIEEADYVMIPSHAASGDTLDSAGHPGSSEEAEVDDLGSIGGLPDPFGTTEAGAPPVSSSQDLAEPPVKPKIHPAVVAMRRLDDDVEDVA